jgi:titin
MDMDTATRKLTATPVAMLVLLVGLVAALLVAAPALAGGSQVQASSTQSCEGPGNICLPGIGDDYPYRNAARGGPGSGYGGYYRECTDFVAWRLNRDGAPGWYAWGNANRWDDTARAKGIRVDRTPALGAVAQWESTHVAYVAGISADGSRVFIEEYNRDYNGTYGSRWIAAGAPSNYLHVHDLNPPPPPPSDSDGDGTPDASDRCPDAAGPPAHLGCPDGDNDGLADVDDKCPRFSGPSGTGGCPPEDYDSTSSGDFNGDGRSDVAAFYDYGGSQAGGWVFAGGSGGLHGGGTRFWDSGPGNWDMNRARFVGGGSPVKAPSAPVVSRVVVGDGRLSVVFTGPSSDGGSAVTNYEYSTDGGATWRPRSPASTVSPLVITGLSNGRSYRVVVRAVNAVGAGAASAAVSVTPKAPVVTVPAAPSSLKATPGDRQAVLSFTPGGTGNSPITNYQVSLDNGVTWRAFSPAAVTSPVTVAGLANGRAYQVRLRAVNAKGPGAATSAVAVTPATVPAVPVGLRVAGGDRQVVLSFTPGATGGSPVTNYQYSLDNGATWRTPTPAVLTSPVTVAGLANGRAYQVRLRAVNAKGPGAATAAVTVTPAVPVTTPGAPTNLTATAANARATISFTPGPTGNTSVTNYQVSFDNGATWKSFYPAVTRSPVTVTGLTNGRTYQVRLRAVNVKGPGAASAPVAVTPVTVPAAPVGLRATGGDRRAVVVFTAGLSGGARITGYQYSLDNGATWRVFTPAALTSPVTVTGLTNGRTYQVRLRAVNVKGPGAASVPVTVTARA